MKLFILSLLWLVVGAAGDVYWGWSVPVLALWLPAAILLGLSLVAYFLLLVIAVAANDVQKK